MVRGLKQWQSVVLTVIVTSMINFAFFALHFDQSNEQNFEVASVLTNSQTHIADFDSKSIFHREYSCVHCAQGVFHPQQNRPKHVCFMQPIRPDLQPDQPMKDLVVFRIFLTSLLSTLPTDIDYSYSLYLGYNYEDELFCDCEKMAVFNEVLLELIDDRPFEVHFIPLYGSEKTGLITFYWNQLAPRLYVDGCQYFFPSNDDLEFIDKGWLETAVQTLQTHCHVGPNVGMVTFKDRGNIGRPYTFHLTHRTHLELFNFAYYPCWTASSHQDPYLFVTYRQMECATLLTNKHKIKNHATLQNSEKYSGGSRYVYGCAQHVKVDVKNSLAELRYLFSRDPRFAHVNLTKIDPYNREWFWSMATYAETLASANRKCRSTKIGFREPEV